MAQPPPRIINESTSLILVEASNAVVYVSSSTTPGHLVTVLDATGTISTPQSILLSTVGGARFSDSTTQAYIQQRFGYLSLHSSEASPSLWSVINVNAFSNPSATADLKGVDARAISTPSLLSQTTASTLRIQSQVLQVESSLTARTTLAVTGNTYIQTFSRYQAPQPTDPRLTIGDGAKIEGSMLTTGALNIQGLLSTGNDFFSAGNISSRIGVISIGGDIATLSNVRNTRGVVLGASSLTVTTTARAGLASIVYNTLTATGPLTSRTISTPATLGDSFAVASTLQYSATQAVRWTPAVLHYSSLPLQAPSVSTSVLLSSNSVATSTLTLNTLSTATTISTIRFSNAQIQNAAGSLVASSIAANSLTTIQSLVYRRGTIPEQLQTGTLVVNPDGVWTISSPQTSQGLLGAPTYALTTNLTSSVRAEARSFTTPTTNVANLTAEALVLRSTFSFQAPGPVSWTIPSTVLQNQGGTYQGGRFLSTVTATTSTLEIAAAISTQGTLQLSAPFVTISSFQTSSFSAQSITASTLNVTRGMLGDSLEYSTIRPLASWMNPSTFQMNTPPFQTTTGLGTYLNPVFFTAANDCVAYYSIIDPRAQVPTALSTFYVNTLVTGASTVIGQPAQASTLKTYYGDNQGRGWLLKSITEPGGGGAPQVSTIGGRYRFDYGDNGPATAAAFSPRSFLGLHSVDSIVLSDASNSRLRRVFFDGTIQTIAGTGAPGFSGNGASALAATFRNPAGTAVDATTNTLFVSDASNNQIRRIFNSTITAYAGTGTAGFSGDGGAASAAQISSPAAVALDTAATNLYFADTGNHRIRAVNAATAILTTIAGSATAGFAGDGGLATAAQLSTPTGVFAAPASTLYIADTLNHRIRKVDLPTGIITTTAGTGIAGFSGDTGPATAARLSAPLGVATDPLGNVFIADTSNHCIRRIDIGPGTIRTIAGRGGQPGYSGDGSFATFANLNTPTSIAYEPVNNRLYISDQVNCRVRVVDLSQNIITTYAGTGSPISYGDGGPAALAVFGRITSLARDVDDTILIADSAANTIRRYSPQTNLITRVAGSSNQTGGFTGESGAATAALLSTPTTIVVRAPSSIYFTDTNNQRIRTIDQATGRISTLAGTGSTDYRGDGGPAIDAAFNTPTGLTVDSTGIFYVTDANNYRIRRITTDSTITTVVGTGSSGTPSALPGIVCPLNTVPAITTDASRNLCFIDQATSQLWTWSRLTSNVTALSAVGPGYLNDAQPLSLAKFSAPTALAQDFCGNLLIADTGNGRLRRTYTFGAPRTSNYLNMSMRYTNYQDVSGITYISLNGNPIGQFLAVDGVDSTFTVTDSNLLDYPLQSSNPATGDQTPWLEIRQTNTTGYIQFEGTTWINQVPGQQTLQNSVNSNAGLFVNFGYLRFPNRINGITIDNKFNDASTRTLNYTGSLYSVSDPALKTEIVDADEQRCAKTLQSLPLKSYAYKPAFLDTFHVADRRRLGFLTTDVASQFPHAISPAPPHEALPPFQILDTNQIRYTHLGTTKALLAAVSTLETQIQDLLRQLPTQRTSNLG